jgi:hypothetical protein
MEFCAALYVRCTEVVGSFFSAHRIIIVAYPATGTVHYGKYITGRYSTVQYSARVEPASNIRAVVTTEVVLVTLWSCPDG